MTTLARFLLAAVISGAALTGCGGGGSSPSPAPASPPPPPTSSGPTFQSGVFEPASTFINRCQRPRSGVDIEGNRFPDMPGSTLLENFWLRSWTRETYLFRDEVVDRNPADFSDPVAYFDVLKTFATTPSGRDKDEFHFTQPTDEFLAERNSAPSATYGARYIALRTTPPRDFRIAFNEAGSPAAEMVGGLENLPRGARILSIDTVDLVNANTNAEIATLNAGLFPARAGEAHSFVIDDGGVQRTVSLVAANLSPAPVRLTRTIDTPTGRVGYILLNTFSPFATEAAIVSAINAARSAGVNDLVLDLRYNGGGLLAIASQLSFMVAGPARISGRAFERLRFNNGFTGNDPVTGQPNTPTPFFSVGLGFSLTQGTPLPDLNLGRVFVLSTEDTCSASESVINGLRGIGVEVILIGDRTCGKPFGFFPQDNCGITYFTTQFQGVNDVGFGDYADGFAAANSPDPFAVKLPGCDAADDLRRPLGDESEGLLAAALQFRADGTCPAAPVAPKTAAKTTAPAGDGLALVDTAPGGDVFATNRDMTRP